MNRKKEETSEDGTSKTMKSNIDGINLDLYQHNAKCEYNFYLIKCLRELKYCNCDILYTKNEMCLNISKIYSLIKAGEYKIKDIRPNIFIGLHYFYSDLSELRYYYNGHFKRCNKSFRNKSITDEYDFDRIINIIKRFLDKCANLEADENLVWDNKLLDWKD